MRLKFSLAAVPCERPFTGPCRRRPRPAPLSRFRARGTAVSLSGREVSPGFQASARRWECGPDVSPLAAIIPDFGIFCLLPAERARRGRLSAFGSVPFTKSAYGMFPRNRVKMSVAALLCPVNQVPLARPGAGMQEVPSAAHFSHALPVANICSVRYVAEKNFRQSVEG